LGEEVSRAQSRGEWPGVSKTFLRGLVGMEVCVGGRASEEELFDGERFGRGERMGGGAIRPAATGRGGP
jgi:hypothetical protein